MDDTRQRIATLGRRVGISLAAQGQGW